MVLRVGGRAVRVAPWPADHATAQLTQLPGALAPSGSSLRLVLDQVAQAGYAAAVTGALGPGERGAFTEAGFSPLAWLYLLERPLDDLPVAPPAAPPLRRVRRNDWPRVAAVDAAAFPPFWQLGLDGIADARAATPSSRMRVALDATSAVVGYAVFGRSGRRGFVQRVAVDPGAQGHGAGTMLVIDGLRWLRARGADSALVNTQIDNDRALALYQRLGFRLLDDRLAVLGRPVGTP
jgi:ribosomal protein S18 acetylase RimI-like enzyme